MVHAPGAEPVFLLRKKEEAFVVRQPRDARAAAESGLTTHALLANPGIVMEAVKH